MLKSSDSNKKNINNSANALASLSYETITASLHKQLITSGDEKRPTFEVIKPNNSEEDLSPFPPNFKYYHDSAHKIIITEPVDIKGMVPPAFTALKSNLDLYHSEHHFLIPIYAEDKNNHIALVYVLGDKTSVIDSQEFPSLVLPDGLNDKEIIGLGSQSWFDPITAGHHVLFNIHACIELITNNQPINKPTLLAKLQEANPVSYALTLVDNYQKPTLVQRLKAAWQSMFARDQKADKALVDFSFPQILSDIFNVPTDKKVSSWLIYILTLGFIVSPIKNIVKLCSEGLLLGLQELAAAGRDYIYEHAARGEPAKQWLWSAVLVLLHAAYLLCNGLRLLVRTITSPIQSFNEARQHDPILGALSVVLSLTGIIALAIVAAPLVLSLLGPLANFLHTVGSQPFFHDIANILSYLGAPVADTVVAVGTFVVLGGRALLVWLLNIGATYIPNPLDAPAQLTDDSTHNHESSEDSSPPVSDLIGKELGEDPNRPDDDPIHPALDDPSKQDLQDDASLDTPDNSNPIAPTAPSPTTPDRNHISGRKLSGALATHGVIPAPNSHSQAPTNTQDLLTRNKSPGPKAPNPTPFIL